MCDTSSLWTGHPIQEIASHPTGNEEFSNKLSPGWCHYSELLDCLIDNLINKSINYVRLGRRGELTRILGWSRGDRLHNSPTCWRLLFESKNALRLPWWGNIMKGRSGVLCKLTWGGKRLRCFSFRGFVMLSIEQRTSRMVGMVQFSWNEWCAFENCKTLQSSSAAMTVQRLVRLASLNVDIFGYNGPYFDSSSLPDTLPLKLKSNHTKSSYSSAIKIPKKPHRFLTQPFSRHCPIHKTFLTLTQRPFVLGLSGRAAFGGLIPIYWGVHCGPGEQLPLYGFMTAGGISYTRNEEEDELRRFYENIETAYNKSDDGSRRVLIVFSC